METSKDNKKTSCFSGHLLGLSNRLLFGYIFLFLALLGYAAFFTWDVRKSAQKQALHETADVASVIAIAIARQSESANELPLFYRPEKLQEFILLLKGLEYQDIEIVNADRKVMAGTAPEDIGMTVQNEFDLPLDNILLHGYSIESFKKISAAHPDGLMLLGMPIEDRGAVVGALFVDYMPALQMHQGIAEERIKLLWMMLLIPAVLVLIVYFMTSKTIIQPIRRLTLAATGMGSGELDRPLGYKFKGEIGDLADAFDVMRLKLKASIDALRYSEQRFRDVSDSAGEYLWEIDANMVYTYVSARSADVKGYMPEELLGHTPMKFMHADDIEPVGEIVNHAVANKSPFRLQHRDITRSGVVLWEEVHGTPFYDEQGQVIGLRGTGMNITERKEHEQQLERIAHYDALTGIPNRTLLNDRMNQAVARAAREQNMMAVCYLDLDGFKQINDTMGHEVGDSVLIEIAKRIQGTIRGLDTVARLGGDEFVILLLGLERGEECCTALSRMLAVIAEPICIMENSLALSASIGVSIYPLDDQDADALLRHADQAMYVAKQSGKNRFHIYDASLDQRTRDQQELLKSIQLGLSDKQFELYYQPKVDLRTQRLVGAEALIRWNHPEMGMIFPARFLPAVENSELDVAIGEWVIATVLQQMELWRSIGLDIEISINISAYHLESMHFIDKLQQHLAQHPDLPENRLQIEVLETVALEDIEQVTHIIKECKKIGVGFALDDFGTGFSSLSYLSSLPVDVLKIDQSFTRNLTASKGDHAIAMGIIALSRAFDLKTVAEGVETAVQFQTLLDMGCDIGQGYGIARPMSAADLSDWAKQNNSGARLFSGSLG